MTRLLALAFFAAICSLAVAADTSANAAAKQAAFQVAEAREQTMAGFTFCYVSARSSVGAVKDAVGQLMPKLEKAMEDPAMKSNGSVTFIYLGTPEDFELQVGTGVEEGAKAPEGFTIRKIEPFHCVTALYSGPLSSIQEPYKTIWAKASAEFQPLPEWREAYLYWEGDESPNNVVHIQVGVKNR